MAGGTTTNRSTAHNIAWNYAGFAYQILINIGLTWYFTRALSVPEYGLFLFVMSLSGTLYLLDMGLSSVLVQAFVEAGTAQEENHLNRLLSTVFVALAALGAVGVLIFVVVAALLPGPFKIPQPLVHQAALVFVLAALIIQAGFPCIALEQVLQATNRFDRINQIQLVSSTVQAVLSIAVLAAGYRIVGLAAALLAATTLRLLLFIAVLPRAVPRAHLRLGMLDWPLLKPLVQLSKWAFLQNLSASLFDLAVWTILGSLGSMREAALFGLASKLPTQLKNLVDRGANVALPLMSQSHAEGDDTALRKSFFKFHKLVFGATIPFVVFGSMAAKPLMELWAGAPYAAAAPVLQWLLLAAFAHALAYTSDLLLFALKRVKRAATISILTGIVSITGALLLITQHGAAGLAMGLAIAQLAVNAVLFTVAACKLAGVGVWTLMRAVFDGMMWPLALLAAEVAMLLAALKRLSPPALLGAAVACGCVYLVLWVTKTAIPVYRDRTRNAL